MRGAVLRHQVGHDLADHGHELEPVPGKAAGHHDLLVAGVPGDHEVLVRRVGVHAGHGLEQGARQVRHPRRHEVVHGRHLLRVHGAVDGLRRDGLAAVEHRDLDPVGRPAGGVVERGEAVELPPVSRLPDVDRVPVRGEPGRIRGRRPPVLHLPLDAERHPQVAQQFRRPRARADGQLGRLVPGRRRGDLHPAARGGPPAGGRLLVVQVGTGPGGQGQVRGHRFLRDDQPRAPFVQRDLVVGRGHGREPAADLRRVQQLVRQVPLLGAAQAAGHGPAVRPAHHQPAGPEHHGPATVRLDLRPQLGRAQQQRHVGRVLEVGLAGDP